MEISYNDCYWADSTLENIEIVYDKITITVFNDSYKKNIYIECNQCAGVTEIITWDEVIIENITYIKLRDHTNPLIASIENIYGIEPNPALKSIDENFYEVKISLINNTSFSVVCKEVLFHD